MTEVQPISRQALLFSHNWRRESSFQNNASKSKSLLWCRFSFILTIYILFAKWRLTCSKADDVFLFFFLEIVLLLQIRELLKDSKDWGRLGQNDTRYWLTVIQYALQLHADLSVYFRNGHNRWILYPEGSIYSSGLSLRECSFWLGSKKVRFYGGRLRSEFKGIEQWLN